MIPPIFFALGSNVAFATASLYYGEYARKISAEWTNYYKAMMATICFIVVCAVFGFYQPLSGAAWLCLIVSGLLGLAIGDIFLLKAFVHLGSGRTLMVFGFQPLLLGFASVFLFNQPFPPLKFLAVLFLIGCLYSFALESMRTKGHWDIPGLTYALIGVGMDAGGILLTRQAFELTPGVSPFFVNLVRAVTTVLFFFLVSCTPWSKLRLWAPFKALPKKDKVIVTVMGTLGTFVSLSFYLYAIQRGHLASISAVAGTSPLFATLFETVTGRKSFTRYLVAGFLFFLAGFALLIAA